MASTSSSIPVVPRYDVFLSFRGEDTRNSFTDHLYEALVRAGLSTFRDNDDIGRGQKLNLEIERAIRESRSSIVVLSKNYARSRWCLDELVLILEQSRNFDHFVLPVFYHVDPSDVRNHRKSFVIEAVKGVQGSKWTEVNVNMWKEALREVADLTGMVLSGLETKFIEKIVDAIDRKLDHKLVSTPAYLTGMENRAEDINYWLQHEKSSVLAICGVRGIGKTTMAAYIYNLNKHKFECGCFLEDIGKHWQQHNGLLGLQKQLLSGMLGRNDTNTSIVREGTFKIEKALQIKRALIVLDDINEHDQLAALLGTKKCHAQTKIIITTRNLDIYAWFGSLSWGCRVHQLGPLNHRESLELLSFHAFGSKIPMEGFKDLAVESEQYCEGNPLALIRLGSSLYVSFEDQRNKKRIIELWRSKLNSLNLFKRSKADNRLYGVLEWLERVDLDIPTPGRLDVYQSKNLDYILTQNSALVDIIKALENESIQIIGIYGLGGVGKTTLAMEVVARVKNKFSNVAFTTVSQNLNVEKIHKDIGEATKQIMKGEKVLIILDDVWEKLNLEELCIPCGINYMNCKILLTSRNEDVCKKMNAQSKIGVDPLPEEEAWILFKHVVGERVETDVTLKPVAMEVVKECGGLPLLIQAVGSALKDRNIKAWKSALTQLKEHEPLNIDPDIKKAYIHLKLSYDYLESEEAKSCFLLCSMFPEDGKILLEDLVYYGVGLAKFNKLKSMNDARDRVQNAVNILTSCGLLLNMNDDENEYTKLHDVVRDVALVIASEGNNKFLVEAGKGLFEWLPRKDSLESYNGISLMSNKIHKLPDYELHLPHLTTVLIPGNGLSTISNEFIRGMKEARVLDMSWNKISSFPESLKLLTKLHMLDVRGNESLNEISILGELKNLEILILCKTGIKEIPQEIGQLVNLRRFDVSKCQQLCHISSGVILKLCWLEELCIGFYSMEEDEIHDSLVEVMKLSKLTYMELVVPCSDVIPKGFNWVRWNGFLIEIGGYRKNSFGSVSERRLVVSYDTNHPNTSLQSIENMNSILGDLYLKGINDINVISLINLPNVRWLVDRDDQLGDEEGKIEKMFFTKLKHLKLSYLESLEVIWKSPDEYISLSNLVTLSVYGCNKLHRVFSVSAAKGLVSLQKLTIVNCHVLKEVISGGDDENIIVFPSLAKISLYDLKSLKSFSSGNSTVKYPSLVEVDIKYCENMNKWGNRIQETPNLKFVDVVPLDGPHAINDALLKSYETRGERFSMTIKKAQELFNITTKEWLNMTRKERENLTKIQTVKSEKSDEDKEVAKMNQNPNCKTRKFRPYRKLG